MYYASHPSATLDIPSGDNQGQYIGTNTKQFKIHLVCSLNWHVEILISDWSIKRLRFLKADRNVIFFDKRPRLTCESKVRGTT